MGFMTREPELFTTPERLLPGVRSVVSFAIPYSGKAPSHCPIGYGRIARYAWGRDYHRVLKKKLKTLVARLSEICGEAIDSRSFSDAVPLLERAYAEQNGLGFFGKNSLLIRPGVGSYFFIADLLLAHDIVGIPVRAEQKVQGCGACSRCVSSCPTGAIVRDGTIDSRRCISYLTIEKVGPFDEWEKGAIGEWLFGCDICQEVCPFNHRSHRGKGFAVISEFSEEEGSGALLSLSEIISMRNDEDFLERFAGTPLMRPGREGLIRNACAVAVNTKATEVRSALEGAINDESYLVQTYAKNAIAALIRN